MSAEILAPNPNIAWAKNTYKTNGDIDVVEIGITKIGIGTTLFQLEEHADKDPTIEQRAVNASSDETRIHVGFLGQAPRIVIRGLTTEPFSLDDPVRLNAAANLAVVLERAILKLRTSQNIKKESEQFVGRIEKLGESDLSEDLVAQIAIIQDRLDRNVNEEYPQELLDIADKIDDLGINEIVVGDSAANATSYTAEWIRAFHDGLGTKNAR